MHRRGVTAVPGLYFLGLPWQHTRGSALLGWVKDDAEYIAGQIADQAATGPWTVRHARRDGARIKRSSAGNMSDSLVTGSTT